MQLGPDTIGHIYELLQRAQSPQPNAQKEAEAALSQLDAQQGFTSCLAVGASESCFSTMNSISSRLDKLPAPSLLGHNHTGDYSKQAGRS